MTLLGFVLRHSTISVALVSRCSLIDKLTSFLQFISFTRLSMFFSKNRSLYIHLSSIEGIQLLNRILHLSCIPSNSLSNFMVIMTSSKLLKTFASTSIPPNASPALKNCSIVYKNPSTEKVEETNFWHHCCHFFPVVFTLT